MSESMPEPIKGQKFRKIDDDTVWIVEGWEPQGLLTLRELGEVYSTLYSAGLFWKDWELVPDEQA